MHGRRGFRRSCARHRWPPHLCLLCKTRWLQIPSGIPLIVFIVLYLRLDPCVVRLSLPRHRHRRAIRDRRTIAP